jgi:uncharacterized membrane protein YfcA
MKPAVIQNTIIGKNLRTGVLLMNIKNKIKIALTGIAIGIINGFFGSAGGIVAVEAMERQHTEEKQAHATALIVILPITVLSSFLYIRAGYFVWDACLFTAIGALAGGVLGALFLQKANVRLINMLFTVIIFITGVRMLF